MVRKKFLAISDQYYYLFSILFSSSRLTEKQHIFKNNYFTEEFTLLNFIYLI